MIRIAKFFRKFIGTKAFYKELLIVSLPIAFQQFISSVVNTLDGFMVAGFGGVDATSAVAIASKYYSTFNMIMFMFAVGCSVFIAQYYGAKRPDKIKQVFWCSLLITVSFSIVALLGGVLFKDGIITLFTGGEGANPISYSYGIAYLSIVVFSFLPQAITNTFTASFRAIRQTRVPLYSAIVAAIVNASLNWILINGHFGLPALGVKGAAIATCIARLVELSILIVYFFIRKPEFYGNIREIFKLPSNLVHEILRRSRPMVIAQVLTETMGIFMLFVYARLELGNSANVAAITISEQINDIVTVFIGGMGTAASVMVGSRLGADKIDEARQHAQWQIFYVIVFATVAALAMILLRGVVADLYNFSPENRSLLSIIMIIRAVTFPFMIFAINIIFITRAGGYTRSPLFITNMVYYGVKLPLVIILVYIYPQFYSEQVEGWMSAVGLIPSFVVFIFIVERFCEVIRSFVALYIYRNVPWYKNITKFS